MSAGKAQAPSALVLLAEGFEEIEAVTNEPFSVVVLP